MKHIAFLLLLLVLIICASFKSLTAKIAPPTNQKIIINETLYVGQPAVDYALKAFKIQIPSKVKSIKFNVVLQNRGLASGNDFAIDVEVGPTAFSSWGQLGATLAHEVEVHGTQSFSAMRALNLISFLNSSDRRWGTLIAERAAYNYEINNRIRFNLTDSEVKNIKETMEEWYGDKQL